MPAGDQPGGPQTGSLRREATTRAIYLPPWRIDVNWRPGVPRVLSAAGIARLAARTLDKARAPAPAGLAITLSDDGELAALNAEHMGEDGPTDVLSFPLLEPAAFPPHAGQPPAERKPVSSARFPVPPGRRVDLGDVVVSVERAIAQADAGRGGQTGEVRWSAADELRLLIVHGVLHVCGWDHAEPLEAAAMRALERQILAADGRAGSDGAPS